VFARSEGRVIVAAIARMTRVYETKVRASPLKVPFGIALLGCLRSPDILAPLVRGQFHTGANEKKLADLRKNAPCSGKQNTE
jgi:mRNA-degrading endonuclease toxin of MazEF toxin-antitoxin module